MRRLLTLTVARVGLATAATAAVAWWVLPFAVRLPTKLASPPPCSPTYLAADGSPLRQLLDEEGQRSIAVVFEDVPETLIHATLAAEDKRFFSHHGIDFAATARALWDDLHHRRIVSGASTITQQLAKTSADDRRPRNVFTKIVEALQARRLEMSFSKERILTEYLNRISYGNLLTGCSSAAQGYFNKPLRDLTPAECAFIAALPQSPTRLNPYKNAKAVRKRQHLILDQMQRQGWLTDEATKLALNEEIKLQHYTGGFAAPHAVALASNAISEGATVQTTIQPALQSRVEAIVDRRLSLLGPKHVTQAAVVVIENSTGHILSLAGSRSFYGTHGGQINGAWTPHSPGSSIKPFTYLLALQSGFTAASIIPDLPIEYSTPTGLYRPENYDHRNYGPVTLRTALGSSLNIPAVRVLHQLGGESLLHKALQNAGISTLNEAPDHYGLGLTIGNAPVRLIELANAYACLARLGEFKPWTLLGTEAPASSQRLFLERECFIIADILSDNQARVLTFGPHSVIRMPFRCAVKTGTSTGYRDNWTVGYTPEFTVGVWVGNFDNTPMNQVSGVTGAGPIFRDVFVGLMEKRSPTWFTEPEGLTRTKVDPRNGKVLAGASPVTSSSRDEWFVKGTLPREATANDYETDTGKAFLPADYAAWLNRGDSWLSNTVCLRGDKANAQLRIISPVDGSVFQIDPQLQNSGQAILLRSSGGTDVNWHSPTLQIAANGGIAQAALIPGLHEITARSLSTGDTVTVRIEIKPPPTSTDLLIRAAGLKR